MKGEAFVSGKDISKLLLHEIGHIVGLYFKIQESVLQQLQMKK